MLVTLKVAASLDGKLATRTGHSQWITGPEARQWAHQLRHEHEAILVGSGTLLQDNPSLTTRGIEGGRSPIRVMLDSRARIPLTSAALAQDGCARILIAGAEAPPEALEALRTQGVEVWQAPQAQPDVAWILARLQERGITSLLVEGGARVHASFIRAGLADRLVLFLAGKILGGEALSWCGALDCLRVTEAPLLALRLATMVGEDLVLNADFLKRVP